MSNLVRISMSLGRELLEQFDQFVNDQGYPTRSEAIQALMRRGLDEQSWEKNQFVAGSITLVYDHHRPGIVQKLTDVQHDYGSVIVSTQHIHLDHDNCMEIIVVKGQAAPIGDLVTDLKATKGLKHTSLVMTSAGTS